MLPHVPRAPEELARVRLSGKPRGGTPPQIVNRNITSEYRDKMFLDHEISFLQRPLQHFKTTQGLFFQQLALAPIIIADQYVWYSTTDLDEALSNI